LIAALDIYAICRDPKQFREKIKFTRDLQALFLTLPAERLNKKADSPQFTAYSGLRIATSSFRNSDLFLTVRASRSQRANCRDSLHWPVAFHPENQKAAQLQT
jgi:hypothetical protein